MYIPASSQAARGFLLALPFYRSPMRSIRLYLFRFYRFYHLSPNASQFTNFTICHFTLFNILPFSVISPLMALPFSKRPRARSGFTIYLFTDFTILPRCPRHPPPIYQFYRFTILPFYWFYHGTNFTIFIFYHYFLLRARLPTINPGRGLCILCWARSDFTSSIKPSAPQIQENKGGDKEIWGVSNFAKRGAIFS